MKSDEAFMRIETDQDTREILAVSFRFRAGKVDETREFDNGNILADYDTNGNLLTIEVLAPCRIQVLTERVARREPREVREMIKQQLPAKRAIGA